MDERYTPILSDEERAALRSQRAARRKAAQQARRRRQLQQLLPVGAILLILVVLLAGRATRRTKKEPEPEAPAVATFTVESVPPEPEHLWAPVEAADTIPLDDTQPTAQSLLYTGPIHFGPGSYSVRAVAVYENGTLSAQWSGFYSVTAAN